MTQPAGWTPEEIERLRAIHTPPPSRARDPIHEEDGRWYFWDETWSSRIGPFLSRPGAAAYLRMYARSLG